MIKHFHRSLSLLLILLAAVMNPCRAASLSDTGSSTLTLSLAANETLGIVSNGATYTLTSSQTFSNAGIVNPADFTGFATATLTVNATGITRYATAIRIIDSNGASAGTSVTFNNSGANTYANNIAVALTNAAAGAIAFTGTTSMASGKSLNASTTLNVAVNAGAKLSLLTGNLTLSGQPAGARAGTVPGISVAATGIITSSGTISLAGFGGGATPGIQALGTVSTIGTLTFTSTFGAAFSATTTTISVFGGANSGGGDIVLNNSVATSLNSIAQSGGGAISVAANDHANSFINVQGNVVSDGGNVTLRADGDIDVFDGFRVSAGSGTLTLAADSPGAGVTGDGIGTLTVDGVVFGATMAISAADVDIDDGSIGAAEIVQSVAPYASGLASPDGLVFDSAGNLFVANFGAGVSEVTPGGSVSTFVTGIGSVKSVAIDSAGNVYAANVSSNVYKYSAAGALLAGPFNQTVLASAPDQMTFDANDNLYIVLQNGTIAKVTPAGAVSTFATLGINSPGGLAFDSAGNLFIAQTATNRILEIAAGQTTATVFVDASQGLQGPRSLVFEASGNMLVSSNVNDKIFKVTPAGTASVFIDNLSTYGVLGAYALALDATGNLYISDGQTGTLSGTKVFKASIVAGTNTLTIQPSVSTLPMQLGGGLNAAVVGINLTSDELQSISTLLKGQHDHVRRRKLRRRHHTHGRHAFLRRGLESVRDTKRGLTRHDHARQPGRFGHGRQLQRRSETVAGTRRDRSRNDQPGDRAGRRPGHGHAHLRSGHDIEFRNDQRIAIRPLSAPRKTGSQTRDAQHRVLPRGGKRDRANPERRHRPGAKHIRRNARRNALQIQRRLRAHLLRGR